MGTLKKASNLGTPDIELNPKTLKRAYWQVKLHEVEAMLRSFCVVPGAAAVPGGFPKLGVSKGSIGFL